MYNEDLSIVPTANEVSRAMVIRILRILYILSRILDKKVASNGNRQRLVGEKRKTKKIRANN